MIAAIIGVSTPFLGILGPRILDPLYYPIVEIVKTDSVVVPGSPNSPGFDITNYGLQVAKNMTIVIQTSKDIDSITNEFSTTAVGLPEINKNLTLAIGQSQIVNNNHVVLNVAKLQYGPGSVIKIRMNLTDPSDTSYIVRAVYDQGSTSDLRYDQYTYRKFIDSNSHYVVMIILAIITVAAMATHHYISKRRVNLQTQKQPNS